jgi:nitrogen regulatory protein P-II 2
VNLLEKIRIEIAVNHAFVAPTIKAIVKAAKSGHIGDGKIIVMPLEKCIRIRTDESGSELSVSYKNVIHYCR